MAKKVVSPKEIYIVIYDDVYEGSRNTLKEAQDLVSGEELNGAQIMKVVQVWEAQFPEEPEMEFYEQDLGEV